MGSPFLCHSNEIFTDSEGSAFSLDEIEPACQKVSFIFSRKKALLISISLLIVAATTLGVLIYTFSEYKCDVGSLQKNYSRDPQCVKNVPSGEKCNFKRIGFKSEEMTCDNGIWRNERGEESITPDFTNVSTFSHCRGAEFKTCDSSNTSEEKYHRYCVKIKGHESQNTPSIEDEDAFECKVSSKRYLFFSPLMKNVNFCKSNEMTIHQYENRTPYCCCASGNGYLDFDEYDN